MNLEYESISVGSEFFMWIFIFKARQLTAVMVALSKLFRQIWVKGHFSLAVSLFLKQNYGESIAIDV